MSKCQCAKCSDSPSRTYGTTHLIECEARHILKWPLAQRREYLAKLPDRRRLPLQAEMLKQHKGNP